MNSLAIFKVYKSLGRGVERTNLRVETELIFNSELFYSHPVGQKARMTGRCFCTVQGPSSLPLTCAELCLPPASMALSCAVTCRFHGPSCPHSAGPSLLICATLVSVADLTNSLNGVFTVEFIPLASPILRQSLCQ